MSTSGLVEANCYSRGEENCKIGQRNYKTNAGEYLLSNRSKSDWSNLTKNVSS